MFTLHSAFLNRELDPDEEVYMEQPQGYKELDEKRYVCKLLKYLYGLKQAGRKWYDTLCKALTDIGFKQSKADPAVFYAHHTCLSCQQLHNNQKFSNINTGL